MFKSFQLGAKKYKIKFAEHDNSNLGLERMPLCEIQIQKKWAGQNIPDISQEQTAFHEVVHAILGEIGRDDLTKDEAFVQSFSLLIHQFFRTMK